MKELWVYFYLFSFRGAADWALIFNTASLGDGAGSTGFITRFRPDKALEDPYLEIWEYLLKFASFSAYNCFTLNIAFSNL